MRFLVIGLGSMGKRRIRNLHAHGEKEIIGFDVSADRRADVEKELGAKTIGDLAELPSDAYDAIIISSSPSRHGDFIRKALYERKHFFVEVTMNDDGYAEVLAAPKSDGIVRAPSCSYRFYAPIQEMKRQLDAGRIGALLSYQHHMGQYLPDWHPWEDYRQVWFAKKETGAIREEFAFEQSWLTWLAGAPVISAVGWIGKISDLDMDADDCLSATVRYENGVVGNTMIDVVSRKPTRRLRLIGTEGVIDWELLSPTLRIFDVKSKNSEEVPIDIGMPVPGYVTAEDMYVAEMGSFLRALRGEAPWPYAFEEDVQNIRALYDLEKSVKTKE